jgi:mRNA-degrading endonuclease toxin of MazEF toxin-antitoxin module
VVVPLSSSLAPSALPVDVAPMVGTEPSRAVCRAVRAVVSARFVRRIGSVDSATMERMEQALALILGLELRSKPG